MNAKARLYVVTQWDRFGAATAILLGAITLIGGAAEINDKIYPGQQLPLILSAGIGGLFLLGLGGMLWLSADMRDEWRKLDSLERAIREEGAAWRQDGAFDAASIEPVRTPVAHKSGAGR